MSERPKSRTAGTTAEDQLRGFIEKFGRSDQRRMLLHSVLFVVIAGVVEAQPRMPRCDPRPGRHAERIRGDLDKGDAFSEKTSAGWTLRLVPTEKGWLLQVTTDDRDAEDLARLTPPWHFAPNPRQIDGWHFRNAENTGPNDGSVNAPQELREFIFSPRIGRDIQDEGTNTQPTREDVKEVRAYGRGWLFIESYRLTPARTGDRAAFESLRFSACLTWPAKQGAIEQTRPWIPVAQDRGSAPGRNASVLAN